MHDNSTLTRIKNILEAKKWSIYHLAKCSNIPYSSLNNIFLRNTEPTLPTLRKICSGLGMTLSEFFDNESTSCYNFNETILTEEEQKLIIFYQTLNKTKKKLLMTYASGLSGQLPD